MKTTAIKMLCPSKYNYVYSNHFCSYKRPREKSVVKKKRNAKRTFCMSRYRHFIH